MTLEKVQPGDDVKFPASTFNAFVDAAQAHKNNVFHQAPGKDTPGDNLILVKNNSGSNADTGSVLGIDGPIFGPDDNLTEFKYNFALKGITPTEDHAGKFVVLAEPIAAGKIGRAYAGGVCPAQVVVLSSEAEEYQYADIYPDVTAGLFTSPNGSASILWKEGGVGIQWAMIRFGIVPSPTCDTPLELYSTFEGSETTQTDTWDVSNQGENDGVKVYLTTRLVYNESGDEVVYGFCREFKYDSSGRLLSISAETRYTIDTPVDCPT